MRAAIARFDGYMPAVDETLLADTQAALAVDCDLDSGALTNFIGAKGIDPYPSSPPAADTRYIWHPPFRNTAPTEGAFIQSPHWEFRANHFSAVPIEADGWDEPFMVSENGLVKYLNGLYDRSVGVSAPATAPAVSSFDAAPNGDPLVERYFVITLVNDSGQEGPPSDPIGPVTMSPAFGNVTIAHQQSLGANPEGIFSFRVYVSAGSQDTANFFFAGSTAISNANIVLSQAAMANASEPLATTFLDPPQVGTKHLVLLESGAIAGLKGDYVVYSHPTYRYGWPADYAIRVDATPVGLARLDQAHVVLTDERPLLIQGTIPGEMVPRFLEVRQPCVSERSIVELPGAIGYAGPDGFQVISVNGARLITAEYFTREQWQAFKPSSMMAVYWNQTLIIFYDDGAGNKGSIWIPDGKAPVLRTLQAQAAFVHERIDRLVCYSPAYGTIMADAGDAALSESYKGQNVLGYQPFKWRSKRFRANRPVNIGAVQAHGTFETITLETFVNGAKRQTVALEPGKIRKLQGGFRSYDWQFQISGYGKVTRFEFAPTARELHAL